MTQVKDPEFWVFGRFIFVKDSPRKDYQLGKDLVQNALQIGSQINNIQYDWVLSLLGALID